MTNDNNDITKFGSALINKMGEKEKDIQVYSETDPMLTLRTDILQFFRGIMNTVGEKEKLKGEIEKAFFEDLASETLTFQEKLSLYKLISTQSNIAAESILSIFKPTPGAPSLLADNLSKDTKEDHFDKMYESMSGDDLQKMDKLMKVLNALSDDKRI